MERVKVVNPEIIMMTWNCAGYTPHKAEFLEHLVRIVKPTVIYIQEIKGTVPRIPGYETQVSMGIPRS